MIISPEEAIQKLKEGQVVAIPTETVYGLAADATNERAVRKIFELKKRPLQHPLICHLGDAAFLSDYAEVEEYQKEVFSLWPGPLTVLLKKKAMIPDIVTGGSVYCGFRIPSHPVALKILRELKKPLAAPSANPFGKLSPITSRQVVEYFGDSVDVVEGGVCQVGIESTVIRFSGQGEIEILRPGYFTKEFFEEKGFLVRMYDSRDNHEDKKEIPSPGLAKVHYQPKIPLILLDREFLDFFRNRPVETFPRILMDILEKYHAVPDREFLFEKIRNKKIGFIAYGEFPEGDFIKNLSSGENFEEMARNLFLFLGELEKTCDVIIAFLAENRLLGYTINDRLRKAASGRIWKDNSKVFD